MRVRAVITHNPSFMLGPVGTRPSYRGLDGGGGDDDDDDDDYEGDGQA